MVTVSNLLQIYTKFTGLSMVTWTLGDLLIKLFSNVFAHFFYYEAAGVSRHPDAELKGHL